MPPVPTSKNHLSEIEGAHECMTPEQRENPIWDPENHIAWTTYFNKCHKRELVDYNGLPAAPARSNSAGRTRWWGMPGRMLPYVLEYIENDNQRPLQAPPQELLVAEEDGHFFVVHLRHLLLRRLLATHADDAPHDIHPCQGRAYGHAAAHTLARHRNQCVAPCPLAAPFAGLLPI